VARFQRLWEVQQVPVATNDYTTDTSRPTGSGPWPEVMLASEVAEYLRISYATVLRMTKAGDLHAIRVGREFRYLRSEIDRLMRQPAKPPSDDSAGDEPEAAATG
jgi:excisionase family DNA binding protein